MRWQIFFGLCTFFGLGILVHLAEKRWPLRKYQKPKSWGVDAVGFCISAAVTYLFRVAEPGLLWRVPTVPGFGWVSREANFVSATVPWPIAFLVSVVVLDFLLYLGHRLLHAKYLWHTHAAHHSVEHLYWFGGNRSSPFHIAWQLMWGALLGLVWPVHGGSSGIVAGTLVYTCIQHFNHANLTTRLGRLEWLFVVPRYHFVHHGAAAELNNSNFGFLLTIWDRVLGTHKDPDEVGQHFPLGLNYQIGLIRLFIGLPPHFRAHSAHHAGVESPRPFTPEAASHPLTQTTLST
ncbi:MAG TPA: sterol desaturase family protein [Stellaceae bacterium]|jgi:sterol desaturase/sphingolipid hydroxylase (fatty acid hydroxylase superfamily)